MLFPLAYLHSHEPRLLSITTRGGAQRAPFPRIHMDSDNSAVKQVSEHLQPNHAYTSIEDARLDLIYGMHYY